MDLNKMREAALAAPVPAPGTVDRDSVLEDAARIAEQTIFSGEYCTTENCQAAADEIRARKGKAAPAIVDRDAQVIDKQVRAWIKERARLSEMIATATGAPDMPAQDKAQSAPEGFNYSTQKAVWKDFGDYVLIEQKRFGVPNEMFVHKVVGRLRSNAWINVPAQPHLGYTLHDTTEDVVNVICCGVSEDKVIRYRVADCKPYGAPQPAARELTDADIGQLWRTAEKNWLQACRVDLATAGNLQLNFARAIAAHLAGNAGAEGT